MEIQGKEREREGLLGDSFRTGCKMHGRKDWTKESVSDCVTWSQKPQFYDRKKYENCKYWLLHKRHSIPHSRDSQCHSARVVVVGVGWLATIHPSIQCGIQAKTPQIIIFFIASCGSEKNCIHEPAIWWLHELLLLIVVVVDGTSVYYHQPAASSPAPVCSPK